MCVLRRASCSEPDCDQYLCNDCSTRVHKHPKRCGHSPYDVTNLFSESLTYSITSDDDDYSMEISPSLESSFVDAELIAILADKF